MEKLTKPTGPCWISFVQKPDDTVYLDVRGYSDGFALLQWTEEEPWKTYWKDGPFNQYFPCLLMEEQTSENAGTWINLSMIASIKSATAEKDKQRNKV